MPKTKLGGLNRIWQSLRSLGIDSIQVVGKTSHGIKSIQFRRECKRPVSALEDSVLGLVDLQRSNLPDILSVTPKEFLPIALFQKNLNHGGASLVTDLLLKFTKNQGSSGNYRTANCSLTCLKWLELLEINSQDLTQFEVFRRCRLISELDFSVFSSELAYDSQPWQRLDAVLKNDPDSNAPWSSSLSLEAARSVLEAAKGKILQGPLGNAISALVLDFDSRNSNPPAIDGITAAREKYVALIQAEFDRNIGLKSVKLQKFLGHACPILSASGLVVVINESAGTLNVTDKRALFRELTGKSERVISTLQKLKIVPIESLGQRGINAASQENIQLLPEDQVSQMLQDEFFDYFDRVRPHVSIEELVCQFQSWLDNFPDELRNFDDNIDAKRYFARGIDFRAKLLGYRYKCGNASCGAASSFSVTTYKGAENGMFFFKHARGAGQISHAKSKVLPRLVLTIS